MAAVAAETKKEDPVHVCSRGKNQYYSANCSLKQRLHQQGYCGEGITWPKKYHVD